MVRNNPGNVPELLIAVKDVESRYQRQQKESYVLPCFFRCKGCSGGIGTAMVPDNQKLRSYTRSAGKSSKTEHSRELGLQSCTGARRSGYAFNDSRDKIEYFDFHTRGGARQLLASISSSVQLIHGIKSLMYSPSLQTDS